MHICTHTYFVYCFKPLHISVHTYSVYILLISCSSRLLLHRVFGLESLLSQHVYLRTSGFQGKSILTLSSEAYAGWFVRVHWLSGQLCIDFLMFLLKILSGGGYLGVNMSTFGQYVIEWTFSTHDWAYLQGHNDQTKSILIAKCTECPPVIFSSAYMHSFLFYVRNVIMWSPLQETFPWRACATPPSSTCPSVCRQCWQQQGLL